MHKPTVVIVAKDEDREAAHQAVADQLDQMLDDPTLHSMTVSVQQGKVGGLVVEILPHVVHPKVETPNQLALRHLGERRF